ncbi:hypothetical protein [Wenxinia marina]|uniref:hypothetical protein n=1 Tax=Wenxinia marina TaxID=390641 RepID=UPI0012E03E90|nr:hypothetical protein [Wenxinia marina]
MRVFAAGDRLASGAATGAELEALRAAMVRQGFYGTGVVGAAASVSPYLSYDSNINGGVTQDRFTVSGLVFEAAPESRAVAGVVVGATGGAELRYAWAEGRVIQAGVRGLGAVAPTEQLGYAAVEGRLCSLNHLSGWTFADFCLEGVAQDRELGRSEAWAGTLGLSTLFETPVGAHDLTVEVASFDGQPQGTLSLETVFPALVADVGLTAGVSVPNETALTARVSGGVRWLWGDAPATARLWYEERDGGLFLGRPRRDRTAGVSLGRSIGQGINVEIRWSRTDSTADLYDDDSVSASVTFGGFSR